MCIGLRIAALGESAGIGRDGREVSASITPAMLVFFTQGRLSMGGRLGEQSLATFFLIWGLLKYCFGVRFVVHNYTVT